jgi:hypothetical protein
VWPFRLFLFFTLHINKGEKAKSRNYNMKKGNKHTLVEKFISFFLIHKLLFV